MAERWGFADRVKECLLDSVFLKKCLIITEFLTNRVKL